MNKHQAPDPDSPNAPAMIRALLKAQEYHLSMVESANKHNESRQAVRHAKQVQKLEEEIRQWSKT